MRLAIICSDETAREEPPAKALAPRMGVLLMAKNFVDTYLTLGTPAELHSYVPAAEDTVRLVVIDLSTRKEAEDTIHRLRWKASKLRRVPRVCLFNGEFDPEYPIQFEGAAFLQRYLALRQLESILPVLARGSPKRG